MEYQMLLHEFILLCRRVIGDGLTGIYLHGSMAMGCFHSQKSDIDLIVVVENRLTDRQKSEWMDRVVTLNRLAPAKGLEISIVRREYCAPFTYPTPFELHFSPAHLNWYLTAPADYIEKMNGVDCDLAAHFMIINRYGVRLYGEEVADVFAVVPERDYADSIWHDIQGAKKDILENPVYVTLNLCRTAAYCRDRLILSKESGGMWGLSHLNEEYCPMIQQALTEYRTGTPMRLDERLAERFAAEMLALFCDRLSAYR